MLRVVAVLFIPTLFLVVVVSGFSPERHPTEDRGERESGPANEHSVDGLRKRNVPRQDLERYRRN
jgi:hypothetical protein